MNSTTVSSPSESLDSSLAAWKDTPWLHSAKQEALQAFQQMQWPKRTDEPWRFSSVHKIHFDDWDIAPAQFSGDAAAIIAQSTLIEQSAGQFIFADNQLIDAQSISAELAEKGVLWLSLKEAAQKHPELVKAAWDKASAQIGSEKCFSLNQALCENGTFLFVPKNVSVELPFISYHWKDNATGSLYPHTFVVAEDNAEVTLIDYYGSANGNESKPTLASGTSTLVAGSGAKVSRYLIQNWDDTSCSFQVENNHAGRDALIKNVSINLGGHYARLENHAHLLGQGAHVDIHGLSVATGEQEFDQRTLQTHESSDTTSNLLFKNALLDKARTIFSGLIMVSEEAQRTDAYQTNNNLLLSEQAEACSLPGLEIEANDVKCSHGATTGQLDPEELFYLQARGIPKQAAYELMIFGFFEEVIEKIDNESLCESIRSLVKAKFKH